MHEPVVTFAHRFHEIDTSEVHRKLVEAYRMLHGSHPALNKESSVQARLYKLIYSLELEAAKRGLEFSLFSDMDKIIPALADCEDVYANLSCELSYLDTLQSTDPKVYKLLKSLVKILLYEKGIPDWSEYIEYAEMYRDSWYDGEDVDDINRFEESLTFYKTGEPAAFLRSLVNFKCASLQSIKNFITSDTLLNTIIRSAVDVIEHPCTFRDFINPIEDSDQHVQIYRYINFSWDFNQALEQDYGHYLDCCADNDEIDIARRLVPLDSALAWSEKPLARTFFSPLARYFDTMRDFKRKYNGTAKV